MRLTQRGVALLATAPLLLAAGFLLGYPELTLLGCAALLAVGLGVGYAGWRPRLHATRSAHPDRVTRGESSRVTLTVRNTSRLRSTTMIAYDHCGPSTVPVPLVRLRPRRDTVVGYPVPTEHRGVVDIGPLRVERRDPLGLLSVAREHGEVITVWVHPKAHPLAALPAGIARSLDGLIDRVPPGTITFDALRQYVVGDELRRVHWRTTARIGQLMVREHVDTSLPRLVILLDDRASAHTAESFEAACEAAASIVLAAHQAELPLALELVSGAVVGGDGRRHTLTREYLDALAEARLHDDADLTLATTRLRHNRSGDTLIHLTGLPGAADLGAIAGLRGGYPMIVAGVLGTDSAPGTAAEGLMVLAATDGADFAAAWDGVQRW